MLNSFRVEYVVNSEKGPRLTASQSVSLPMFRLQAEGHNWKIEMLRSMSYFLLPNQRTCQLAPHF